MSKKDDFFNSICKKTKKLDIDGVVLQINELSVRVALQLSVLDGVDRIVAVICDAVTDADGNQIFDKNDADKIAELPFNLINAIASEVLALSSLTDKGVEDAEKN